MAARTRSTIKTIVQLNHGRGTEKSTLEDYLCDSALKFALMRHNFKDAVGAAQSDITLTEDATSVDMSGTITGLVNVVTARIVEASGSRNSKLVLKTRDWWDAKVLNPEDNQKGWPAFGLRVGNTMHFDRPLESGLELRVRCTTEQTFASDATVCPIYVLDLFVEHYVTAHVFKALQNDAAYKEWMISAVGARYLIDGTIGGELANAIQADTLQETALEIQAEGPEMPTTREGGVSVENLITGHDDYGNTRWWK